MSALNRSTPIYDAILELATPAERTIILAGGPRERLDNDRVFGGDVGWDAAEAAYAAIKAILTRIGQDRGLRFTGIDARVSPPSRQQIGADVISAGRLTWSGPGGVESVLQLEWASPMVRLIDLKVEPVETIQAGGLQRRSEPQRPDNAMRGPRVDDGQRLAIMRKLVNEGLDRQPAAALALDECPCSRPGSFDSKIKRLMRKYAAGQPK